MPPKRVLPVLTSCGESVFEVSARADTEFHEHVAQVPLDGSDAEEQLGADLGVGATVAGQSGDVLLL